MPQRFRSGRYCSRHGTRDSKVVRQTPLPPELTGFVYWIGHVHRAAVPRSGPVVDVVLSDTFIGLARSGSSTLLSLKVDVRTLRRLFIGSRWASGQPETPGRLPLREAVLDPAKVSISRVDRKVPGVGRILDAYPVPADFANARILVFETTGKYDRVIVPAFEIARYFYCYNADLARSIFDATILTNGAVRRAAASRFDGIRFAARVPVRNVAEADYALGQACAIVSRAAATAKTEREGDFAIVAHTPTPTPFGATLMGLVLPDSSAFLALRVARTYPIGAKPGAQLGDETQNLRRAILRRTRPT